MTGNDYNRWAYRQVYDPAQIDAAPVTPYDQKMVRLRHQLVEQFGSGQDVVDLGCGTGQYLIPNISIFRSAIGVDFSERMLESFVERIGGTLPKNLKLMCIDISELSLPKSSADFLFSFSTLYYVGNLPEVLRGIATVLRPGGRALLELGNLRSLNVLIWNSAVRSGAGWARHQVLTLAETRKAVDQAGLTVEEWRSFQVLPFSGVTRGRRLLYPIVHPAWKHLLGFSVGGKILDERLSSLPLLRSFAFRHLVILKRE